MCFVSGAPTPSPDGAAGQRNGLLTAAAVPLRRPSASVPLPVAELILMACAAALAVALSRTAPPPAETHSASAAPRVVVDTAL